LIISAAVRDFLSSVARDALVTNDNSKRRSRQPTYFIMISPRWESDAIKGFGRYNPGIQIISESE